MKISSGVSQPRRGDELIKIILVFKILLSQIFKIPCDICHAHTFRTIDVVAICSRLFVKYAHTYAGIAHTCHIFFLLWAYIMARIICRPHKFCARLYICARIYGHHGPIKVTYINMRKVC